jgi:hypothetical protein
MKALKTIVAVVFSFALIATQIVFGAPTERVEKKCKGCCCKTVMKCCATSTSAPAQPQPAQTSRTVQNQIQLAAAFISLLPQPVAGPAARPIITISPALASQSVPLFTRNCSFLI